MASNEMTYKIDRGIQDYRPSVQVWLCLAVNV